VTVGPAILSRRESGVERSNGGVILPAGDVARFPEVRTHTVVDKYEGEWDERRRIADPKGARSALYESIEEIGNALLLIGASVLWECLIGNGTATGGQVLTYFNGSNTYLGVGTSSTAPAVTQTDLQASLSGERTYQIVDATYPQHTAWTSGGATAGVHNRVTFRSTFGTSAANYAWNECVTKNNGTFGSGTTLNRKNDSLGTKVNTATWVLTVTIDLG
jgi:hypothetical protein